jgi:hypothetical protein
MLTRAMKPVLVRQHVESAPPGLLAEWLEARGIPYVVDRSWEDWPLPDPGDYAFVVSLGHTSGPGSRTSPSTSSPSRSPTPPSASAGRRRWR